MYVFPAGGCAVSVVAFARGSSCSLLASMCLCREPRPWGKAVAERSFPFKACCVMKQQREVVLSYGDGLCCYQTCLH